MNNDLHATETKEKMSEALKALIKIKPFAKITVGDIVSYCEINRNTFYYHFENIYDLLYWAYSNEIQQNLVSLFQEAQADITQGIKIILLYIDRNLQLCQTAYESLGEDELKNMFERDLKTFVGMIVDFYCEALNKKISSDYRDFLIFSFSGMLGSQIVLYIKYNEQLDKARYLVFIENTFLNSLSANINEGGLKNL